MKQKHRDGLRDSANLAGGAIILYLAAGQLLRLVVDFLLKLGWKDASLAKPGAVPPALLVFLQLCMAVLSLVAALAFLKGFTPHALMPKIKTTDPKDRRLWLFLPVFLGIGALCSMLTSALQHALPKFTAYTAPAGTELPEGGLALMLSFFTMCVVPALLEERLCRGYLQGMLRPWGAWLSILAPSLVFALLHTDIARLPGVFILSVCLGLVAHATGSIMPSIVLHFSNNLMSFLLMCAAQKMTDVSALAMTLYLVCIFFLAAAVCVYLIIKWKLFAVLRPVRRAERAPGHPRRLQRIFAAPLLDVALVWLLLQAVLPLISFAKK